MNILEAAKACVGCGACVDICPVHALSLTRDQDGFYQAALLQKTCVDCGRCIQVCPAVHPATRDAGADFYYGWHLDETVRQKSSSGGAFSALAEKIIADGGVVFGARYADDHRTVRMASSEECHWTLFRGSKYCQSVADGLFSKVTECLQAGKQVMLVGTPCQIAAARRRFGKHDGLLLVDFMCGGVAPDTVFAEYTSWLENKYHSKIKTINMREKRWGWSKSGICVEFENGKQYAQRYQFDPYYHYYYHGPIIKNAPCLTCAYTGHPDADLTIADFWGYKEMGIANDEKGLSLICVYTERGKAAVDGIRECFVLNPLDETNVQYAYRKKSHSAAALQSRADFLEAVRKSSFIHVIKQEDFKFGKIGILTKIFIRKVRKVVGK